ncbi:MAG: hypothetical protein ACRC8S_22795, partial [Fimbriiglobus sp.]
PQLLFGADRNRNGRLDPGEDTGIEFSRGWAEFLTVYGREIDTDIQGNPRMFLNDPALDAQTMHSTLIPVLGQELADYVVAAKLYGTAAASNPAPTTTTPSSGGGTTTTTATVTSATGNVRFQSTMVVSNGGAPSGGSSPKTVIGSLADLNKAVTTDVNNNKRLGKSVRNLAAMYNTQVTLPKAAGSPPDAPTVIVRSPLNDPAKVKELLPKLLEYTTTRNPETDYEMIPRINMVTAPREVLLGIPGLQETEVDAIISAREGLDPTAPETSTGGFIFSQANVPISRFANLEKYMTGKTMVYRVHSVGYFGRGGTASRIEAVIDTNLGHPRILYYRDVSDLGKGFDLPR